ncbi:hypothetical protein DKY63_26995 [Pseudomonas putida]|uniref:Uncharacterized protein n=1 Tax=Pseudomonas putida TaxID=303 RepID=A0A2Z4RQW9_PSEPU|nr:hypothetical protein DKY63_26995 [Pseudomonas putida]
MVVNDNAGCLTPHGVLQSIASRLAPTGIALFLRKAPKVNVYGKLRDHKRRFRDHEPSTVLRVGINVASFASPGWE